MTARVQAIRSPDELRALTERRARRGVQSVSLELLADRAQRARLETRINRHLASCGCVSGAVFVAIGLVYVVIASITAPHQIEWHGIVESIAWLFALGLIGKGIGLLTAEIRLRAAIRDGLRNCPSPLDRGQRRVTGSV